jgi:cobalt-zinc-cadmium efflux system protein
MAHDHDHGHHDHEHHHGHAHSPPGSNLIFAAGTVLNLGFVAVEVWYGLKSSSLALLSDAAHNLSDVFALLIAWAAFQLGKSLPTKRRTYGLRRSSILAALANALVLLVVVGGIVWEAIGRFGQPEAVQGGTVMAVAAVGVAVNGITALMFMAGRKQDLNINGAFLHMAADAAVSLGVVLAGFGILMSGWTWLDPAVGIAVGAIIIWSTWGLLWESLSLAMDAVPAGIDSGAVEAYLAALPGVATVHDLHIWGMSTTEVALTAHLVMPKPPADDRLLGVVCHELRERFRIGHVTIQIEHGDIDCRQAPANVV